MRGLAPKLEADLSDCDDLTSLPSLDGLRRRDAQPYGCSCLTSVPDVSSLTNLSKVTPPGHLFEWEKRGCVAYDFYRDGFSADVVESTVCFGLSLPSLDGLTALGILNLWYCSGLKSLPSFDGPTAPKSLNLQYCSGLTSLLSLDGLTAPDAQQASSRISPSCSRSTTSRG